MTLCKYILIIPVIFLGNISDVWPDTSELGLGIDLSWNTSSQKEKILSDYGTLVSADSQTNSKETLLLQSSLGLSFRSSIWFGLGMNRQNLNLKPEENSVLCLDHTREENLARGAKLNFNDQCIRVNTQYQKYQTIGELGYSYKPYDDLSPYIDIRLGTAFTPSRTLTSKLAKSTSTTDPTNRTSWQTIEENFPIYLPSQWEIFPKLQIGFEKRVKSRWGIRISIFGQLNYRFNDYHQPYNFTYGLLLALTHYQYLRFL